MKKVLKEIRVGLTKRIEACGHTIYVTVNFDDEEFNPLEVFLVVAKEGSTLSGLVDSWAITLSKALKYGCPWPELKDCFMHQRFEPSDVTNPSIVHAIAECIENLVCTRKELWN